MEINFKFNLGDIVTTAESAMVHEIMADDEYQKFQKKYPIALTIVERRMQECPGGVQLFYHCAYFTNQGYVNGSFHEEQLVIYPRKPKAS